MAKETLVNKSDTFEDWRQKSNEVSLDLGAISSDSTYTASSLDTEARLTDQYITKNNLGDNGIYIRDVSALPGGLEIDFSADRKVDNTDGYIILKDGVTTIFPVGTKISQFTGNSTGTTAVFTATVVSATAKKILIENVEGSFNSGLNLYNAATLSSFIATAKIKELIVESYNHGNVRVYRSRNYSFTATATGSGGAINATANKITLSVAQYYAIQEGDVVKYTIPSDTNNSIVSGSAGTTSTFFVKKASADAAARTIQLSTTNGGSAADIVAGSGTQILFTNRVALPQDMTRDGFHIAPHNHFVTLANSPTIPVTFVEGEVLYQGSSSSPDFQGTLLTADISGILVFKNIISGTFNAGADLISTTVTNSAGTTLSGAAITIANANLTSITSAPAGYAQMIEFNFPAVAGDDYKVYFGSAVDAVLELQDDVGTVENLTTSATTDLTVAINELELGLRGTSNELVATDLGGDGTPMSANNVVSGLLEHEADLFGAEGNSTKRTLASLNTEDKASIVDSINELETGIRGTSSALVAADLGSTSGHPAMTADDLVAAVLEHEVDLYGTSGSLSSLTTNSQASFVTAINELEVAIRGTDNDLVGTDLTTTLAPYTNDGTNLKLLLEQLVRDIGDVTQAKLGVLNNNTVQLATHGSQINSGATVLTMVSNPITAGIKVGMFVTGTGIETNTGGGAFVTVVSSTQVTISRATTANITSGTLTFKVEDLVTKVKGLDDLIGSVTATNMGTAASTVVTAIREHNDELFTSGVSFTGLAGSNFKAAVEELRVDIGNVGDAGATIKDGVFNNSTVDLMQAVSALGAAVSGTVELDTAFGASGVSTSLANAAGYSATDIYAGIKEIQAYLGDVSTLSTDVDDTHTSTIDGAVTTAEEGLLTIDNTDADVNVGYIVTSSNGDTDNSGYVSGDGITVIKKISGTQYVLSKTAANAHVTFGDGDNIVFSRPDDYGFNTAIIKDALLELKTALVGSGLDLTSKIATLDDSDGTGTDFQVTNVVDAIREVQDDIGTLSSLSSTPFAANSNIQGSYTNTSLATIIASTNEYIGGANISAISGTNNTITEAISKLHAELGSSSLTDNLPSDFDYVVTDHTTAINTLSSFVGNTSIADIGTTDTLTGALQSLHAEIGTGSFSNDLPSDVTYAINAQNLTGQIDAIAGFISGTSLTTTHKTTITGAINELHTEIGGEDITSVASGNDTITGALVQLHTEIGDVTGANLGTASTNVTAAIKEIIDGTGQAAVTVSAAGSGGTSIAQTAANGGFLKKVKAGHGAGATGAQTIVSNINFNAAATTGATNVTTLTFGANTVLDISAGSLITESANADFTTTAKKIVLGATTNDGQGLEIDRDAGPISAAVGNTAIDPSLLWVDTEVTDRDDSTATVNGTTHGSVTTSATPQNLILTNATNVLVGMVATHANLPEGTTVTGKSSNTLTLSNSIIAVDGGSAEIAAGQTVAFTTHNRNDLAWQITGFRPTTTPDNIATKYIAPNVDFFNAHRLFGKGTGGLNNTETGVVFTWNTANQHFDVALESGVVSAGTTGSESVVPVITVDTHGRVTSVGTANVSNSLGTFNLQADSGTEQTVSVTEKVKIAGTANEIETAISTTNSGATNVITIGLPNNVTIADDLNVTDDFKVNTDKFTVDGTTGNTTIAGTLNVSQTITSGGSSLGFTTTSATVSSKQIILNALAGGVTADTNAAAGQTFVPAASFVAHRGFKSTAISGAVGTLTKGKRYRVSSVAANNAISGTAALDGAQAGLKTIAGITTTIAHEDIITATTTGIATVGDVNDITLVEQEVEAKIAWNEGTSEWELYKGSDTSAGNIVTQGSSLTATLSADSLVTPTVQTTENITAGRILFDDGAGTSKLLADDGILYNNSTNTLSLKDGKLGIGSVSDGQTPPSQTTFVPDAMLHLKSDTTSDVKLIIESDSDNNEEAANPIIELYQDGRNLASRIEMTNSGGVHATGSLDNSLLISALRLSNSTGDDMAAIQFATKGDAPAAGTDKPTVRMTITESSGFIGIGTNAPESNLDIRGGFRVENAQGVKFTETSNVNDDLTQTAVFASNDLTQANSLSSTVGDQQKQAVFVSRTGSGGNMSFLDITNVRTSNSTGSATATKRLQHRISSSETTQGTRKGFIDFPGDSERVELGGINSSTEKKGVVVDPGAAVLLYHNTNNANASAQKLATTAEGIDVTGTVVNDGLIIEGTNSTINQSNNAIRRENSTNDFHFDSLGDFIFNVDSNANEADTGRVEFRKNGRIHPSNHKLFTILETGDIQFYSGAAGNATGTVGMTWDSSAGSLGIGTDTPASDSLLELVSDAPILTIRDSGFSVSNNDARLRLAESKSGNVIDNFYDVLYKDGLFAIRYNDTNDRLKIDASGNIGIGKTPGSKLDVNGAVEADAFRFTENVAMQAVPSIRQGSATSLNFDSPGGFRFTLDSNRTDGGSNHTFTIAKSATDATDANSKPVFLVSEAGDVEFYKSTGQDDTDNAADFHYNSQSGGKLGLGTTSPSEKLDVVGNIRHQGLTMTSGTDIDQVFTLGPVTIGATDFRTWQDTGIDGTDLLTGTYIIQLYVEENASGGVYSQYYSGVMSWYSGATHDTLTNEILLHNAGHAAYEEGGRIWFLRVQCAENTDGHDNMLQIRSGHDPVDAGAYTIKIRRMI